MISRFIKPSIVSKCALVASVSLAVVHSVSASLSVSEPFDYSGPFLSGQSGGIGWGTPWDNGNSNWTIVSGLTYPGLATSGNAASASATGQSNNAFRGFAAPVSQTNGSIYVSFLLNQTAANYANVCLYSGDSELISFGDVYTGGGPSSTYGLNGSSNVQNGGFKDSGVAINTSSTQFLVMEIDYSVSGQVGLYLYLNPDPTGETPLQSSAIVNFISPTTSQFTFDRVRFENGGGASMDELRVGTTWSDIISVPEPSSTTLAALGGASLLFTTLRRKRRLHP